jgi:hypothetical protein
MLAGWQRGGSLTERLAWVAIGVVLVVSAHLLPALASNSPSTVRSFAGLLWACCMAAACFGHATFFLFAQQHAGAQRTETVVATTAAASDRSLTQVMAERASVTRQLAFARLQRCPRDCGVLEARRVTLAAKLDALDAESNDVRRRQVADDQIVTRRDALLADPVTSRLAALLAVSATRVDLFTALVFAAVLECVACLLWTLALRSLVGPGAVVGVTIPMSVKPRRSRRRERQLMPVLRRRAMQSYRYQKTICPTTR